MRITYLHRVSIYSYLKIVTTWFLGTFLISAETSAQNSVGIGTSSPNHNAVLDLVSPTHNQGLLVPRLTRAQRTAVAFTNSLASNDNGLIVFDSDDKKFYYWKDNLWQEGLGTSISTASGITWHTGTIDHSVGKDGDFYLDLEGSVYEKNNGIYTPR